DKLAFVMDLKNNRRGRIREYVEKYPGATYLDGERPWKAAKCDVALPCATQNEINAEEAKALLEGGCVCVAEGANMPSEPDAIAAFHAAGILFAPGKASNAGGVAVSGLEMAQNSMRISWTREEVDLRLQHIMKEIHEMCVTHGRTGEDHFVDYVDGANIAGFIKVADAMLDQGVV
ncbi:glutamate dehydrogenase, partial [bacterium]|nr:glutamate dehydrogenase [bacterium]